MCRCNGVNSILYESHKALTLDVSFVVLLMYNNGVDPIRVPQSSNTGCFIRGSSNVQ